MRIASSSADCCVPAKLGMSDRVRAAILAHDAGLLG
jgi:hypothetical protein